MAKEQEEISEDTWKKFIKKHGKITLLLAAGIIGAVIGAIFVFLWRTTGPDALALYPATLDLWTVGYIFALLIDLVLWELLIIGVPVLVAAVLIYVLWWNKLPAEEKQEYESPRKDKQPKKKVSGGKGSGVFNFLFMLTWLIIIATNGKWDAAFRLWTFTYLIDSVLNAFLWDLLILGIPAAIALIWWLRRELNK